MAHIIVPVSVRDLTRDDLPSCGWSGTATHLANVATQLDRALRGEVDYLAVCPPSNLPVATGMIDYQANPWAAGWTPSPRTPQHDLPRGVVPTAGRGRASNRWHPPMPARGGQRRGLRR